MNNQRLTIRIFTPKALIFEGQAISVSSTNSEGRFDILPEHANFITLVENKPIDIQREKEVFQSFKFTQAVIYSYKNDVSIFAEPNLG